MRSARTICTASMNRPARTPGGGYSRPAPIASSLLQPAPSPASNRPPDTACIWSAACANSTGERSRLLANDDVSTGRVVAAAIVASVTHTWGNGRLADHRWSAHPSTCQPSASRVRAHAAGSESQLMKLAMKCIATSLSVQSPRRTSGPIGPGLGPTASDRCGVAIAADHEVVPPRRRSSDAN